MTAKIISTKMAKINLRLNRFQISSAGTLTMKYNWMNTTFIPNLAFSLPNQILMTKRMRKKTVSSQPDQVPHLAAGNKWSCLPLIRTLEGPTGPLSLSVGVRLQVSLVRCSGYQPTSHNFNWNKPWIDFQGHLLNSKSKNKRWNNNWSSVKKNLF